MSGAPGRRTAARSMSGRAARTLRVARSLLAAILVVALGLAVAHPAESASLAGDAGIDTSLPLTDSAVTVKGRGRWSGVEFTLNQSKQLVNQAVSLTWTGAPPTEDGATFKADYMQVMQCWGDDDGSVPGNPGPPPEQCVYGGFGGVYGGFGGSVYPEAFPLSRIMSVKGWETFDASAGFVDQRTGFLWRPFQGVNGTVVDNHTNPSFNPAQPDGQYWLNPFFNYVTTNEIPGGRTLANGTGAELFEVNTGVENTGLGCGQRVEPDGRGGFEVPRCWLVIVPRGTPAEENAGTPLAQSNRVVGTSPLSEAAWKDRIAIPLEFTPVDTACQIGAEERRVVGNELAMRAVAAWQPVLCGSGLPPYSYALVGDGAARQQVTSGTVGAPGMAVTSAPVDPGSVDPLSPAVYAPLTLSGAVIGFNVERNTRFDAPGDSQALKGLRVSEIDLTPRLVAKLLTQSYASQLEMKLPYPEYPWLDRNPLHLGKDPDFLRFNPEFETLNNFGRNFGGLTLPASNSDLARQLWSWILADPEAAAWLDGEPDEWGMVVNPVYSTNAQVNTTGVPFGDPPPDSFPKSDPYCYESEEINRNGNLFTPPPLCGLDWMPYVQTMRDTARATRAAYDGAKIVESADAYQAADYWKRDAPQTLGSRTLLSLTDTSSASQYGLQTARLSRAGDDTGSRTFVAADAGTMRSAVGGMVPVEGTDVLVPDPGELPAGAYPLTQITYATVRPLDLDDGARADYAAFVEYAAGDGQVAGLDQGQLPPGYAPLPDDLRAQARAAAVTIRTMPPVELPAGGGPASFPSGGSSSYGSPGRTSAGARSTGSASPLASPAASAEVAESVGEEQDVPLALTPILALARSRWALVVLAAVGLGSVIGALEITKRPRRATAGSTPPGGSP